MKLEKICLNFVNNFVLIDQYSPSNCPGNLALPITQIMAQLQGGRDGAEEDMMLVEVAAEELDLLDGGEEGEGEGGEGFEDIELELVDGDKDGIKWLIINQVHILYSHERRDTKKSYGWECSGRRRLGCEFKTAFVRLFSTIWFKCVTEIACTREYIVTSYIYVGSPLYVIKCVLKLSG